MGVFIYNVICFVVGFIEWRECLIDSFGYGDI